MTAQIVILAHYRPRRIRESGRLEGVLPRDSTEPRPDRWAAQLSGQKRLAESRSQPRHIIEGRCSPRLTLDGKPAVIRNVSRHGLMAVAELYAAPGSRVLATLAGSRPISARVVWRDGCLIGLDLPIEWPTTIL